MTRFTLLGGLTSLLMKVSCVDCWGLHFVCLKLCAVGWLLLTLIVYNHVLRLDLNSLRWELVDNYGDIPGVRMGSCISSFP